MGEKGLIGARPPEVSRVDVVDQLALGGTDGSKRTFVGRAGRPDLMTGAFPNESR